MVETFRVDDPRLPLLHDCVIEEIELTDTELIIRFDAHDFPMRESAQYYHPEAASLVMRFQLVRQPALCRIIALTPVNRYVLPDSIHEGRYRPVPLHLVLGRQPKDRRTEYLYHPYEDDALYVHLWQCGYLVLRVEADAVQYHWLEA